MKGRVLLLNEGYQVLGTVGVARAVRMMLRELNPITVEATVPDKYLTTGKGVKYPVPSVIRLKHFVDIVKKRQVSGAKRLKIYVRDGYKCQYCSITLGKPYKDEDGKTVPLTVKHLTLDHILPKSRNGEGTPENMVTACKRCNQKKADRTPEEARMPLITKTHSTKDVGLDKLLICQYIDHRPEWRFFIEGQPDFEDALEKYDALKAAA